MDKNKIKEHIQNAIYQLDPFAMDSDNYDDHCKNCTRLLEEALKELFKHDA